MERHECGEAVVIPVILRPCSWHNAPFGKILAATKDGKAITKYPTLDDGLLEVTTAIEKAVEKLTPRKQVQNSVVSVRDTTPSSGVVPRSSNLRITRQFSDHDKDEFLEAAFNFICNFLEGSLEELAQRNPDVQTRGTHIDMRHFMAKIYRNGQQVSGGRIWYGGRSSFSSGINPESVFDGSFNESLSAESDGYSLYLKPLGMQHYGRVSGKQLTKEGAAEYFWAMLIEPLQI
jgi:hypothetical protein